MKKLLLPLLFLSLGFVGYASAGTCGAPDLLEPDSTAFNRELLIDIKGDTVAGYALVAAGAQKKETVLIIKGYPGNDSNYDVSQQLRANGFNVIMFDHRGAWGSQGDYLYSNCLEDIELIIKYLSSPAISKELRIDTSSFTLIGRSLGGGVALISGSQLPQVKKVIGISNVNYGALMQSYETISELKGFKRYMKKQIMMNHDIQKFLIELLENKEEYNISNYSEQLSSKAVLLLEDTHKNDDWIELLDSPDIYYLDSDHNFINQREEMIDKIIAWLK